MAIIVLGVEDTDAADSKTASTAGNHRIADAELKPNQKLSSSSSSSPTTRRFLILILFSVVGFAILFKSERMFVLPFLMDPSSSAESSSEIKHTTLNGSTTMAGNALLRNNNTNSIAVTPEVEAIETSVDTPKVAWLMTYPNSGTTYTLKLIQQYTNTTTATNYGYEQSTTKDSIPIAHDRINGPFWRFPTQNKPKEYVLTKTHCGGNCICAKPEEYVETPHSFEIACRSGSKTLNNVTKIETTYSALTPKRAIHLFRNPFDNVVARLHLEQKKWIRKNNTEFLNFFTKTKTGFHRWCKYLHIKANHSELSSHLYDNEMLHISKSIPCHAEFIRYTWWHDLALGTIKRMELPYMNLYYENYTYNWEPTVEELFDFLHLTPADGAEPAEFIVGKHYVDYFEEDHLSLAKDLIKTLASKELWSLIKHYF